MESPSVSSRVVTGRRVSWWRRVLAQPGFAIFAFGSPPVLLWALYRLVVHHRGMDVLGYMFWGGLALVAVIGCVLLNLARTDGQPLEAACPVCGTRGIWSYIDAVDHPNPIGQLCSACGAYDGTNGLEIRELSLDAKGEFEIDSDRYAKHVKRDAEGRMTFTMPSFCAVCGSDEATHRRKIDAYSAESARGGGELVRQANYALTGHRGQIQNFTPADAIRGVNLQHLEVPVCDRHVTPSAQPDAMWTNDAATLRFGSYRFYKAFCSLNDIAAPNGSRGFPSARAVEH